MLSDLRRLKFLEKFSDHAALEQELAKATGGMGRLKKAPWFIGTLVSRMITRKMKKIHFAKLMILA